MPEGQQTNVIVAPPQAVPQSQGMNTPAIIPVTPPEGYRFYEKLVDPEVMFLNKITGILYGARLVKSNTPDPDSPVPGYSLVKIGGTNWKHPMNLEGYQTTVHDCLLILGEDKSTTIFPDDYNLALFSGRKTMSIIGMMGANREDWEFSNYTLIYPFGLSLWNSIVAIHSRSIVKKDRLQVLLDKIFHPNMWMQPVEEGKNQKAQFKWLNFG